MRSRELQQTKLFESRELRIDEFSVRFKKKFLWIERERSIPLEDLLLEHIVSGSRVEGISLFLTLLFLVTLLSSSHWMVGAVSLMGCLVMGSYCWSRSGWYLQVPVIEGEALEIYGSRPSPEVVGSYFKDLKEHVRAYAINKYGVMNELLPADVQMQRLTWLRDRNFISDLEFGSKVDELRALLKLPAERTIGFRNAR